MRSAHRELLYGPRFSPYRLPNMAARYSVDGAESDATYLTNGLGRVRLIADRSGNSAENCLVLNGASGNYASTPDSAAVSAPSNLDIEGGIAANDYTAAIAQMIGGHYTVTGNQRSYYLGVQTTGHLILVLSTDGTTPVTTTSTQLIPASDLGRIEVRATWAGATGTVTFYTRSVGAVAWTQLGDPVASGVTGTLHNSTGVVSIGANGEGTGLLFAGRIYYFTIRTTIGGAAAFAPNFTLPAKLAGTFTESSVNAATVTINTSGDLGARICGARDLYQGTTTKMALLSTGSDGRNLLTFDGSNDYMKAAPFSLSQPETVYFVGSQVTWTSGDEVFAGNALSTMTLYQRSASPTLTLTAGATGPDLTSLAVGTRGVVSSVFNGANSAVRLNRLSGAIGDVGAANAGGFTLASAGTGTAGFSNITFNESLIFSVAHDGSTQLRVANALIRKWAIAA